MNLKDESENLEKVKQRNEDIEDLKASLEFNEKYFNRFPSIKEAVLKEIKSLEDANTADIRNARVGKYFKFIYNLEEGFHSYAYIRDYQDSSYRYDAFGTYMSGEGFRLGIDIDRWSSTLFSESLEFQEITRDEFYARFENVMKLPMEKGIGN